MELLSTNDLETLIDLRHDLHEYPEKDLREYRTRSKVEQYLLRHGIERKQMRRAATTGLIVNISGKAPSENDNLSYRSVRKDVAHVCGHDGHIVSLLGFVCILMRKIHGIPRDKCIRLLFQPAEERKGGAQPLISEKALDGVDEIFGYHNWPLYDLGVCAVKPGEMMAECTDIDIIIRGHGGHLGLKEKTVDPLKPAVVLYQRVEDYLKEYNKKNPRVYAYLPTLQCGDSNTIISDRAQFKGSMRSYDPEGTKEVTEHLKRIVAEVAIEYKVQIDSRIVTEYPVLLNNKECANHVSRVFKKVFGDDKVTTEGLPVYPSEDFAFYTAHIKGAFFFLGTHDAEHTANLHSSNYDFNDKLLEIAAKFWWALAADRLDIQEKES